MNKLTIYIYLIATLLWGCDKIDEGDRNIPAEDVNATRPVLLEDFTGQNCINCPEAANRASTLKKALKENLVIVSIHAGPFSTRTFRTDAGTAYQERFYPSNDAYPVGMIDRSSFEGSRTSTNYSKWGTYVLQQIQWEALDDVSLSLSCNYSENEESFTVNSEIHGKINSPIMLQLWITEDNIVAWQRDGNITKDDYVHNHVLRDAVNGIWGEEVDLEENNIITSSYSLTSKNWVPENLNIVGFLYDASTYEVLYVTEISLLNN